MSTKKIKAVILGNELKEDIILWEKACKEFTNQISYRVVDLTKNNWLSAIQSAPFDILLAKPSGLTSSFKQLYDEKIYILYNVLKFKIFPAPLEIFLYENKRFLSFWLKANNIPHPRTQTFYHEAELKEYIKTTQFPLVAKTNIGASGSGVIILKNKADATHYKECIFSHHRVV